MITLCDNQVYFYDKSLSYQQEILIDTLKYLISSNQPIQTSLWDPTQVIYKHN